MKSSLKIGVVNYLNTRPMMFGFEKNIVSHDFEFVYAVPSKLAEKLTENKLDIALVPVVAYFENQANLELLRAPAICSFGEVKSVKLYSNKPLQKIKSIALDSSSRTSSALIQVLFRKYANLSPKFIESEPKIENMMEIADAGLLIGDKTFHIDESPFVEVVDLGEWWTDETNLPFVFAVWVTRNKINPEIFTKKLDESFRYGFGQIRKLATEENGLSEDFVVKYLTENIQYKLSKSALSGMEKFLRDGQKLGLFNEKL